MQRTSTEQVIACRVNADNVIESVDSGWISFAQENQASHLSPEAVIEQPLFRFITGMETHNIFIK